MEQSEFAKKLTLAGMGFSSDVLKELVAKNPKSQDIANIFCFITKKEILPSKIDATKTSIAFSGQFEGMNLETGETFQASKLYVPGVAEAFLEVAKDAAGEGACKTAIVIYVLKDTAKNSAQGYKFGMRALVNKEAGADIFKDMRNLLPAPKKAKAAAKA